MESHRLLLNTLMVMMTCCLAVTWARMNDDSLPVVGEDGEGVRMRGEPLADDLFSTEDGNQNGAKRNNQEDISKLLLKHLRFRQLPEPASSSASSSSSRSVFSRFARRPAQQEKRHEQRMLVNNLAALLSGLRDRQVESSMRMPSLRFGK